MNKFKQDSLQNYILYSIYLIFFIFLMILSFNMSLYLLNFILLGLISLTIYNIFNIVQYYEINKNNITVKKLLAPVIYLTDEHTKFILIKNNQNLIDEIQIKTRKETIKIYQNKDNLESLIKYFLTNKLKTEENFPEHASYKILRTNKIIKAILFFAFLITIIEFLLMRFTTIYPLISKTIFYFFIGSALPLLSFFNLLERKSGYNLPEIYIFIFAFFNNFFILYIFNLIIYKEKIRTLKMKKNEL